MMQDREFDFVKVAKSFVKGIAKDPVYRIMDALRDPESIPEPDSIHEIFTYVQVLEYAVEKKLKYSNVSSTLLKLTPSEEGLVITQVFIDDAGKILQRDRGYLGRQITTKELDEELKDILGDNESVVIDLPQN